MDSTLFCRKMLQQSSHYVLIYTMPRHMRGITYSYFSVNFFGNPESGRVRPDRGSSASLLWMASVRKGVAASWPGMWVTRPYFIPATPLSGRVVGNPVDRVTCRTASLDTPVNHHATTTGLGLWIKGMNPATVLMRQIKDVHEAAASLRCSVVPVAVTATHFAIDHTVTT